MESETVCLSQDTSDKEQATVIVIIKHLLSALSSNCYRHYQATVRVIKF